MLNATHWHSTADWQPSPELVMLINGTRMAGWINGMLPQVRDHSEVQDRDIQEVKEKEPVAAPRKEFVDLSDEPGTRPCNRQLFTTPRCPVSDVTCTSPDLLALQPSDLTVLTKDTKDTFLNDAVVNSYNALTTIGARQRGGQSSKRIIMNSQFVVKAVELQQAQGLQRSSLCKALLRWLAKSGVVLKEVEVLIVPVNAARHWYFLELDLPAATVAVRDSALRTNQQPHISANQHILAVFAFLENQLPDAMCKQWSVRTATDTPQQTNGRDCGVFMVKTIRAVVQDTEFDFSQDDMARIRDDMHHELLTLTGFTGADLNKRLQQGHSTVSSCSFWQRRIVR